VTLKNVQFAVSRLLLATVLMIVLTGGAHST
jgi:hypothetical protein